MQTNHNTDLKTGTLLRNVELVTRRDMWLPLKQGELCGDSDGLLPLPDVNLNDYGLFDVQLDFEYFQEYSVHFFILTILIPEILQLINKTI